MPKILSNYQVAKWIINQFNIHKQKNTSQQRSYSKIWFKKYYEQIHIVLHRVWFHQISIVSVITVASSHSRSADRTSPCLELPDSVTVWRKTTQAPEQGTVYYQLNRTYMNVSQAFETLALPGNKTIDFLVGTQNFWPIFKSFTAVALTTGSLFCSQ